MIRIVNEETAIKRVASYKQFDNGHVLHGDWKKMTSDEAENLAKQKSLENPDDIFYVAYDDIMNPDSDLRWINGKSYHYSEVKMQGNKPMILKK